MIYLDNAATTFPKPRAVCDEVYRCMTRYCGNPGRGSHSLSLAAAEKIFECRNQLAGLFGSDDPGRIIFTQNATYSLNLVIKGLLRHGDHVIISDMEHNAVYRPVYRLASDGVISFDVFSSMINDPRRSPTRICARIARLVRPNTRMVICVQSSNICSASLPIAEIGSFCRNHNLLFVVDGSQSAGLLEADITKMNIDAYCAPGHKGLYGPQGCGFAVLGERISPDTFAEGGSGMNSLDGNMPDEPPERYEAGTLPTPAVAGLCEGIKFVRSIGIETLRHNEEKLYCRAREMLGNIEGVSLYAPQYTGSTLLFNIDGISSDITAQALDSYGICTRGGYHCSALGHKTLGTPPGGAVRISFGAFNREYNTDYLCSAIRQIKSECAKDRKQNDS